MRDWWNAPTDTIRDACVKAGISSRKSRLFAVALCRMWVDWMPDQHTRELVDLAELFADGRVTDQQLQRARRAVYRWANKHWNTLISSSHQDWARYWAAWNAAIPKIVPPCYGFFHRDNEFRRIAADIFGSYAEPLTFDPTWRTSTAVALAQQMYESRDFSPLPILADALQDAGCEHPDILSHCRGTGVHVRGCWVVDLVLAKQ